MELTGKIFTNKRTNQISITLHKKELPKSFVLDGKKNIKMSGVKLW